ncbi:MAG: GNAT family N-acetyltransferase [Candidatus Spechtbacteria bacterium]|nr:GNAT family N-acetyltransferase [Candidatus Spechtbacteria bacterium]
MLRPALENDLKFILGIRNLPEVVQVSNRKRSLALEELPCVSDSSYVMWIVHEEGQDYGYVMAHREDSAQATISIALSKNARGKGLGTRSIQDACSLLFVDQGVCEVLAEIYKGNSVSERAFEKSGFTLREVITTQDGREKQIFALRRSS